MSNCSTAQGCANEFKQVYLSSDPNLPKWKIKLGDSVCHLDRGLKGLEYLHAILSWSHEPEFDHEQVVSRADRDKLTEVFETGEDEDGHAVRAGAGIESRPGAVLEPPLDPTKPALSPSGLKRLIAQWNTEARVALASGNQARYNALMVDVNGAQRYLRESTAHGGKSRRFPDQRSREAVAERMAINYAIAAIRKQAPLIADHFSATITMSGGRWSYNGTDEWDTESEQPAFIDITEPELDWTFTAREENIEVLAIRLAWGIGTAKRDDVLAAILNYRERSGIMEQNRDANFERKMETLEEKLGVTTKKETPTERVAELLRRNKARYAGRGNDFIFEQTRREIQEFYRDSIPATTCWWEARPAVKP